MHTAKQILNDLMTIKAGSINNFYSPQAKSYDGSVQWPTVCFKDLEKQGLIKRIPFNVKVINKRREVFYFVTKKGSDYIDRRCEQRDKEPKSYNNAIHESMKYDIALAFVRSFREFDIEFNYKADINGIRPDILIKMTNKYTIKRYIFLVEIERKREPLRTYKEKLLQYEEKIHDPSKHGLPHQTKILVVYTTLNYNVYIRPQEYKANEVSFSQVNTFYKRLLNVSYTLPAGRYRFLPFHFFPYVARAVWQTPKGEYVKLII